MAKWLDSPNAGGFYLQGAGFLISWQPQCNLIGGDHRDGETALITEPEDGSRGVYLILNGDWRTQYGKIVDGGGNYDSCKAFYDAMASVHRGRWSEDKIHSSDFTLGEALKVMASVINRR
jgi:hypothetical protein